MQYKVKVYLEKNGETYEFDAEIGFSYNPDTYGNGYYMGVKSKEEPFGLQSYDIRYNRDFDKNFPIEFITLFYSRRFDGKKTEYDTKWKMTGIDIHKLREEG